MDTEGLARAAACCDACCVRREPQPRRRLVFAAVVAVALVVCLVAWHFGGEMQGALADATNPVAGEASARHRTRPRRGGMDVTFLVTADTHFGAGVDEASLDAARSVQDARGIERAHLRAIRVMNGIEGKAFPGDVGGVVGKPLGLLVAGDLTDTGHPAEWARFVAYYGYRGGDGLLRYPTYETWGNHDKYHAWYVRKRIEERHGGIRYGVDWQDLHVVCLGEAPDHEDLAWLAEDLRAVGNEVGLVLYLHFPLAGPFSGSQWFGRGDYRARLADVLRGARVLGIFHGHYHATEHYVWNGIDVYNVGSPKHGYESFFVVRVTDARMVVGSWDYRADRWEWVHGKDVGPRAAPSQQ